MVPASTAVHAPPNNKGTLGRIKQGLWLARHCACHNYATLALMRTMLARLWVHTNLLLAARQ